MSDLDERIRHALAVQAQQIPVPEREWEGVLEETRAPRLSAGLGPSRTGRRQLALGFATVVLAVATVATALGTTGWLDADRDVSVANQPTTFAGPACSRYGEARRPEQVEGLRFLPRWLPPGKAIAYAAGRAEVLDGQRCSIPPTALVLIDRDDADRNRVERAALLSGPSPVPFRTSDQGPVYDPIEIRGVVGTLRRMSVGPDVPAEVTRRDGFFDTMTAYWTEADGSSWSLQATHLSKEELVQMAETFTLDPNGYGPPASAPIPPAGYEVAWQLAERPGQLPDEVLSWRAHTNRDDGAAGDLRLNVERQPAPRPAIGVAVAGVIQPVHLVDVRGHPAVFLPGQLTWDEAPGVQVRLQGNADLATMVQVAESFAPVSANDPRITRPGGSRTRWFLVPIALGLAAATAVLARRLRRREPEVSTVGTLGDDESFS